MSFNIRTEEYYKKFIELQEKLRKSEEERLKLEIKFNEMLRVTREEEQNHYRKLRSQYKRFLEEDRRRQDRNERILRTLERIEFRVAVLMAKTERFRLLRQQYHNFLDRIYKDSNEKKTPIAPPVVTIKPPQPLQEQRHERISVPVEQGDIVQSYLKNLSSQKLREMLKKEEDDRLSIESDREDNKRKQFVFREEETEPNYASSIADDIMNSIYSKHKTNESSRNLGTKEPNNNNFTFKDFGQNDVSEMSVPKFCGTMRLNDSVGFENKNRLSEDYQAGLTTQQSDDSDTDDLSETRHISKENIAAINNADKGLLQPENIPQKSRINKADNNVFKDVEKIQENRVDKKLVIDDRPDVTKELNYETNHGDKNKITQNYFNQKLNDNRFEVTGKKTEMPLNQHDNNKLENYPKQPIQENITNMPSVIKESRGEYQTENVMNDKIKVNVPLHEENISKFVDSRTNQLVTETPQDKHESQITKQYSQKEKDEEQLRNNDIQEVMTPEQTNNHKREIKLPELQSTTPVQDDKLREDVESVEPVKNDVLIPESVNTSLKQELPRDPLEEKQPQMDYKDDQLVQNLPEESNQQQQPQPTTDENEQPTLPQEHYDDQNVSQKDNKYSLQPTESNQSVEYDQYQQPQYHDNQFVQQYDENDQPLQPQHYIEGDQYLQYDENNQVIQQYDENGQLIQVGQYYDENGQPVQYDEQYDQSGQQYDEHGQPYPQYDENGQYQGTGQIFEQYDEHGNLIQQYDESGQVVQQYDEHGQLIQQYEEQQYQQYDDENGQVVQPYAVSEQDPSQLQEGEQIIQQYGEGDVLQSSGDNQQLYEKKPEEGLVEQEGCETPVIEGHNELELKQPENQDAHTSEPKKTSNVMEMLDTDTESAKHDTKISNDSDFDFSNG